MKISKFMVHGTNEITIAIDTTITMTLLTNEVTVTYNLTITNG